MSQSERPRVQFVSKPIQPPFRDGTKCLVRDLCLHLQTVDCHVLTSGTDLGELEGRVVPHAVYGSGGSYRPGLVANLRAAAWLGVGPKADAWHFVFAPNPRSSQVGRWLRHLRRVPVVQTIASPPRSFEAPERLLFGDRVVAQSHWTRDRFLQAYAEVGLEPPAMDVVFPPAPEVPAVLPHELAAEREALGLADTTPFFVYPGDLEVSSGARRCLDIAAALRTRLPTAVMVLAYRRKTSHAEEIAEELRRQVDPSVIKITGEVSSIWGLMRASKGVVFPVDDLYGKVDLPIVLLEAFSLGVPVVALDLGPLRDLGGAKLLPPDPTEWARFLAAIVSEEGVSHQLVEAGKRAARQQFSPHRAAASYEAIYQSLW